MANTLHPHKDSIITTWHSSNGLVHNQIDYILTPKRFKSSIIRSSTRTYPGADVNSDHDLVMSNLASAEAKTSVKQEGEKQTDSL